MRHLKAFALIISIALFYFVAAYFAAAALAPELAYPAALVAVIAAMIIYRLLGAPQLDQASLPFGLLLLLPLVCLMAGVIWWLLRLLGFWTIR